MKYTLYDTDSGLIYGVLDVADAACAAASCGPGQAVIAGEADGQLFIVSDGGFIERPEADISAERQARAWTELRKRRDRALAACDWTQISDAPVDQAAWRLYRQQLRDLPETVTDPEVVQWPTPPNEESM